MPRPQRSRSKTNPEFDPQELADLIHTPAVGSGVASHLLDRSATVGELTTVVIDDLTTVANVPPVVKSGQFSDSHAWPVAGEMAADSDVNSAIVGELTTVANGIMPPVVAVATVVISDVPHDGPTVGDVTTDPNSNMTTVVLVDTPAVSPAADVDPRNSLFQNGEFDLTTVPPDNMATVGKKKLTTVLDSTPVALQVSTVVESRGPGSPQEAPRATDLARGIDVTTVVVSTPLSLGPIWVSEEGDYIPPKKVRRVRYAQDALSAAEESVYDLLWSQKGANRDEPSRIVQAGYDFIMKRTRLSKKTVQRIIDKLTDKDFIAIEVPADIYRRLPTTYRVFGYRAVLDRMAAKNRLHVAKIGPGIVYVLQLGGLGDLTTVATSPQSTVADSSRMAGAKTRPTTVVPGNPTTVAPETTLQKEQQTQSHTTASSSSVALQRLMHYGPADDDAAAYLVRQCQRFAEDATSEEIGDFIDLKGALTLQPGNRIQNPIGFLLTAVPKCFQGQTLQLHRAEANRKREDEARRQGELDAEFAAMQDENRRILADPNASEEDRRWAQKLLDMSQ